MQVQSASLRVGSLRSRSTDPSRWTRALGVVAPAAKVKRQTNWCCVCISRSNLFMDTLHGGLGVRSPTKQASCIIKIPSTLPLTPQCGLFIRGIMQSHIHAILICDRHSKTPTLFLPRVLSLPHTLRHACFDSLRLSQWHSAEDCRLEALFFNISLCSSLMCHRCRLAFTGFALAPPACPTCHFQRPS